jgi:hypothetical protein
LPNHDWKITVIVLMQELSIVEDKCDTSSLEGLDPIDKETFVRRMREILQHVSYNFITFGGDWLPYLYLVYSFFIHETFREIYCRCEYSGRCRCNIQEGVDVNIKGV